MDVKAKVRDSVIFLATIRLSRDKKLHYTMRVFSFAHLLFCRTQMFISPISYCRCRAPDIHVPDFYFPRVTFDMAKLSGEYSRDRLSVVIRSKLYFLSRERHANWQIKLHHGTYQIYKPEYIYGVTHTLDNYQILNLKANALQHFYVKKNETKRYKTGIKNGDVEIFICKKICADINGFNLQYKGKGSSASRLLVFFCVSFSFISATIYVHTCIVRMHRLFNSHAVIGRLSFVTFCTVETLSVPSWNPFDG